MNLLLPILAAISFVSGWTIVNDGKSSWVILVKGDSPALQHGAEEIATYIEDISGARLPVVTTRPKNRKAIVVQQDEWVAGSEHRSAMAEEEFVVKTAPGGLVISGGGKRGPIYGCYAFLEEVLGCRWFTSKVSLVPSSKNIYVPSLHKRERPALEYREPYFREAFDGNWAVRNRVNGNGMALTEQLGGKITYSHFVHTFSELVPPEKYFAEHPEYFSLVDGKRQGGYAQLCLTNPDVLKITIDQVRKWIKENPDATIFSVSQNDTYANCQCENCKRVEEEEGSPSGPVLRFVNQVADAIGKDYPNVLIDTLAYQWTEKPPLHERPHENVRIRLAPIGACVAHPLDKCEPNQKPYQNLTDWSKITNQLYIWHYCTNFANYLQPIPDLDEIAADIQLFKRNGVVGLFYEGDYSLGGGGSLAELKSYLMAKLMWNPNQPARPIVEDFIRGVYRGASAPMQEWVDMIEAYARRKNLHAGIYDPPSAPYLQEGFTKDGDEIFARALSQSEDDPSAHEAVEYEYLSLLYVELMQTSDATQKRDLADRFFALAEKLGITEVREGQPIAEFKKQILG